MKPEIIKSLTGVEVISQSSYLSLNDKRLLVLEGYGETEAQAKAYLLVAVSRVLVDCKALYNELKADLPDGLADSFLMACAARSAARL